MKTVADLLKSKPQDTVHIITPTASVYDALKLMADMDIGALLVMEGAEVAGIITERHCARKVDLMLRTSRETWVHEIMTTAVMHVRPDQTSEECMVMMTEHRLRHLPVMEGGKLLGLISIGDLVKDVSTEQKFVIRQLEQYISGEQG